MLRTTPDAVNGRRVVASAVLLDGRVGMDAEKQHTHAALGCGRRRHDTAKGGASTTGDVLGVCRAPPCTHLDSVKPSSSTLNVSRNPLERPDVTSPLLYIYTHTQPNVSSASSLLYSTTLPKPISSSLLSLYDLPLIPSCPAKIFTVSTYLFSACARISHTYPETHVAAGYKATLSNPNTSEAAKEHAASLLERIDPSSNTSPASTHTPHQPGEVTMDGHEVNRVMGGYKATLKSVFSSSPLPLESADAFHDRPEHKRGGEAPCTRDSRRGRLLGRCS